MASPTCRGVASSRTSGRPWLIRETRKAMPSAMTASSPREITLDPGCECAAFKDSLESWRLPQIRLRQPQFLRLAHPREHPGRNAQQNLERHGELLRDRALARRAEAHVGVAAGGGGTGRGHADRTPRPP